MFNKDDEYVVLDGEVKIVDEQTGRIEPIDLLGVYKLGEKRIEQYGEGILNICRPFSDGLSEEDKRKRRLMRRLLQWNIDTARHEGLEAYQICSKVTLRAIAARRPQDLAELA